MAKKENVARLTDAELALITYLRSMDARECDGVVTLAIAEYAKRLYSLFDSDSASDQLMKIRADEIRKFSSLVAAVFIEQRGMKLEHRIEE